MYKEMDNITVNPRPLEYKDSLCFYISTYIMYL
jgi:hypothetical protein